MKDNKNARFNEQARCKLFSERLKELLRLVEPERIREMKAEGKDVKTKIGKAGYNRQAVAEAIGISEQSLTHYTRSQAFPRYEELQYIIKYLRKYMRDLNADYLLCLTEDDSKTIPNRIANTIFGFKHDNTAYKMFSIKEKNLIKPFEKFLEASNYIKLLETIEKVVTDLAKAANNPNLDTNKLNDVLVYGQWLLESEFKFCTAEFIFKDYTKFQGSYYSNQQKILQNRRDKYVDMINSLADGSKDN